VILAQSGDTLGPMDLVPLALSLHDTLTIVASSSWDRLEVVFDRAADGTHAFQHVAATCDRPLARKPKLGDPRAAMLDAADAADEIARRCAVAGKPWQSRALALRRDGDGLVLEVHGERDAQAVHVERIAPELARLCILTEPFVALLADIEAEVDRRQAGIDAYVGDADGFTYDDEARSLVFTDARGGEKRVPADILAAYDAPNMQIVWGHAIDGPAPASVRAIKAFHASGAKIVARPALGCRPSLAHRLALSAAALMEPEGHGAYRDERDPDAVYYYSLAPR
jgi:hypothetical protein